MNDSHPPYSAQQVLDFWFGAPNEPGYGEPRKAWFAKDEAFDAEIRRRFGGLHQAASHGMLDYFWKDVAGPNLALVITLDQFSRQFYRGEAKAFAQDAHALRVAKHAIDEGFDRDALPVQRLFWYLPFEHSEALADQDRSIELIEPLGNAEWTRYAREHRDVIARFGRFPHRNAALGRDNTPEEQAYLDQPGAGF
ncbi:MAG: DUF924 domain-containing protein [Alphaproteobacteria bacterium]|nr:DUF924 domain-containing protein [Alphaproteobacteria bacterium]MCB9928541.1 DUF924 domain-containing protein [Alphaproteobacteria bacterium]